MSTTPKKLIKHAVPSPTKEEDLCNLEVIKVSGISTLEEYANKADMDIPSTFKYPKFNIQSTNSLADVINCFLQYLYSTDSVKKKT